jgi:predicted ATPase
MVTEIRIEGFRSIRALHLRLAPVTVVVGANGAGKTNLYQALRMLQAAAAGTLARAIADAGGMPSVLWAGSRKKGAVRLRVEAVVAPFTYELALGLPTPAETVFATDPVVKEERIRLDGGLLLDRAKRSAKLRDAEGRPVTHAFDLWASESALARLSEPQRYPALFAVREALLAWRFYHQFRTDEASPLRQPQVAVSTPVLTHDGRDLAAALRTIQEIGDEKTLAAAVDRVVPGARLDVADGSLVRLATPGLHRPLDARELSDGTLRFLCLAAALLSPRPPPMLALNEPETSLHESVLPVLADLVAAVPRETQLWVTTHARPLADALAARGAKVVELEKVEGETRVVGARLVEPEDDEA